MKNIFTLLFIFLGFSSLAQVDSYPVVSNKTNLKFYVVDSAGKLSLDNKSSLVENEFITIEQPKLLDADILMPLSIQLPEDALQYTINVQLINSDEQVIAMDKQVFSNSGTYEMSLLDVTENGLFLNDDYALQIQYDLTGNFVCEPIRPEFNWTQKRYPVILTGIGIIGIGISEIGLRSNQQEDYDDYVELWKEGLNESESVAQGKLEDARAVREKRIIILSGSAAMIAGGSIWYWLKRRNILKNQKRYDRYCSKESKISIGPDYSWNMTGTLVGVKLSYNF